jgi:hypothetical protein
VIVVVVFKKSRVAQPGCHSYKCLGGLLSTESRRAHYVRRINGQDQEELMQRLYQVKETRHAQVA